MTITLGKPYRRGGDKRWVAPWSDRGRRGASYGRTRKEAVEKRDEAIKRVSESAPISDSRTPLSAFTAAILATTLPASGRSAGTVALYAGQLNRHVLPVLGTFALGDLRPQDVESMLLQLDMSSSGKRTVLSALSTVLDYAVRDRLIAANPAAVVTRPRLRKATPKALSRAELDQARKAIAGDRLEPLFLCLMATGMRRGEALGLKWSDISAEQITIRRSVNRVEGVGLVVGVPKTASSGRTVPLGPGLARVLTRHKTTQMTERLAAGSAWAGGDWVFTNEIGGLLEPRNVLRRWTTLTGHSLHSLRHSAATGMLSGGADIAVVSRQLGHTSLATTQRYVTALPAAQVAGAALIDIG